MNLMGTGGMMHTRKNKTNKTAVVILVQIVHTLLSLLRVGNVHAPHVLPPRVHCHTGRSKPTTALEAEHVRVELCQNRTHRVQEALLMNHISEGLRGGRWRKQAGGCLPSPCTRLIAFSMIFKAR